MSIVQAACVDRNKIRNCSTSSKWLGFWRESGRRRRHRHRTKTGRWRHQSPVFPNEDALLL
eukprot:4008224-Amphidinium_carterae.1